MVVVWVYPPHPDGVFAMFWPFPGVVDFLWVFPVSLVLGAPSAVMRYFPEDCRVDGKDTAHARAKEPGRNVALALLLFRHCSEDGSESRPGVEHDVLLTLLVFYAQKASTFQISAGLQPRTQLLVSG
jgi:hypothetical protein